MGLLNYNLILNIIFYKYKLIILLGPPRNNGRQATPSVLVKHVPIH
jgi:hypothetical protein